MRTTQKLTEKSQWSERALERYLMKRVRELGGLAIKYYNAEANGYPDRLCMFPGGCVCWVELKSTGKRPRPLQQQRMEEIRRLGIRCEWADTREKIDRILLSYERTSDHLISYPTYDCE